MDIDINIFNCDIKCRLLAEVDSLHPFSNHPPILSPLVWGTLHMTFRVVRITFSALLIELEFLPPGGYSEPPQKRSYVCSVCGSAYSHSKTLGSHLQLHLGGTKCQICHKVLSRKCHLNRHMLKRHGVHRIVGRSPAPSRVRYFLRYRMMQNAARERNETVVEEWDEKTKRYVCQDCGTPYKSLRNLLTHKESHTKMLRCDICKQVLLRKKHLGRHLLHMHGVHLLPSGSDAESE
uniref:C2H2-type domain-containing protein n=1 Tax=Timema bartmani TaxID=61472 RepID=A0A7R9EN96_9NEOP|nr:unnamed protein product [Timema bartmani]